MKGAAGSSILSRFLLSTAEAVLRRNFFQLTDNFTSTFLLSTAEAVLRHFSRSANGTATMYFYCLPLRRY